MAANPSGSTKRIVATIMASTPMRRPSGSHGRHREGGPTGLRENCQTQNQNPATARAVGISTAEKACEGW